MDQGRVEDEERRQEQAGVSYSQESQVRQGSCGAKVPKETLIEMSAL